MFGNLGFGEMLVIVIVGLVVIGPKRLPEVARVLGKGLAEFRKASNEVRSVIRTELSELEDQASPSARPPWRAPSAPIIPPPPVPETSAASTEPAADLADVSAETAPATAEVRPEEDLKNAVEAGPPVELSSTRPARVAPVATVARGVLRVSTPVEDPASSGTEDRNSATPGESGAPTTGVSQG